MVVQKATMTAAWCEELTWAIRRLYAREGQQEALRILKIVEDVYGEEVAYEITCALLGG